MSFQEYIKSIGFVPNRENDMHFSGAEAGMCQVKYNLGDKVIIWGLHEKGKPPTLISPRPKEAYDRSTGYTSDDNVNRLLSEKSPEEVFNLLSW